MRIRVIALWSALLAPCVALAQVAPPAQSAGPGTGAGPGTTVQGPPPGGQMRMKQTKPEVYRVPGPMAAKMRRELGAWWKNSDVVRELGLSQQQVSQIEQAFFDHRLRLIDLKASVEREEMKLQPLIEADQVNEAQVSAQIDNVLAARGALEKTNVMMMLSIRKVLTVAQWKKLEEIKHDRERDFFKHVEPALAPYPTPPPDTLEFIPDRP